MNGKEISHATLRLPGEMGRLVTHVAFPNTNSNPMAIFEFCNGERSLFDLQKGLFLSPPTGIDLPSRETLKALGQLLDHLRGKGNSPLPSTGKDVDCPNEASVSEFAVCS